MGSLEHYEEVKQKVFSEDYAKMHDKDLYKMYKGDPEEEELGGEEDIIAYWKWLYFKNRWNKITPFDEGGRIGQSYALCKFKYWEKLHTTKWKSVNVPRDEYEILKTMLKILHPHQELLSLSRRALKTILAEATC